MTTHRDIAPDFDTVESVGLDGTLRAEGSPVDGWTWEDVDRARDFGADVARAYVAGERTLPHALAEGRAGFYRCTCGMLFADVDAFGEHRWNNRNATVAPDYAQPSAGLAEPHRPTMTDSDALDAIAAQLTGREWSAADLEDIAAVVSATGRTIAEPSDTDEDEEN